jgi:hypothetical protein
MKPCPCSAKASARGAARAMSSPSTGSSTSGSGGPHQERSPSLSAWSHQFLQHYRFGWVRVGRDRARYPETRFSIPPVGTVHATFTAHGPRLPGPITVFPFRLPTGVHRCTGAGSYFDAPDKLWPFAMYAAFPRSDYYGHADSLQTYPRFSGVVSNPLLPLSLSSAAGSPTFVIMDSTGPRRWRLSTGPIPAYRGSSVDMG